jgi:hypothetical protein
MRPTPVAQPAALPSQHLDPALLRNFKIERFEPEKDDPVRWLRRVDVFFKAVGIPESQYTSATSLLLNGDAWTWWDSHLKRVADGHELLITDWATFSEKLKNLFRAHDAERLAKARLYSFEMQVGGLRKYVQAFRSSLNEIDNMPETEKIDRFLHGLTHSLWRDVQYYADLTNTKWTSLEAVVDRTEHLEGLHRDLSRRSDIPHNYQSGNNSKMGAFGHGPSPMEIGYLGSYQSQKPSYNQAGNNAGGGHYNKAPNRNNHGQGNTQELVIHGKKHDPSGVFYLVSRPGMRAWTWESVASVRNEAPTKAKDYEAKRKDLEASGQ